MYSPHTSRRENLPFEYKENSKKLDKTYRKMAKNPGIASSKISSWTDAVGNITNSEMNSNIYRSKENQDMNAASYKKTKSCRRSGSTKRKRKKHQLSVGLGYESNTIDNTSRNTFATQLISLIHQLHSPKDEKSQNNQNFKKIIHSKSGQHYKAKSKSSMHSRSNTTENPHKIRRITQINNERSRKGSKKARKSLKTSKRNDGSQKHRSSCKYSSIPVAKKKGGIDGFTNHGESTISDNKYSMNASHNKSMLGERGGTLNSMGPMMKSFCLNSVNSTWINNK